jgi:peptidoglycan/xylan/chitin deacetylase (PgdA/CDA1 family)
LRGSVAGAARWLRASVFEKSGVHARQRKHLDGTRAAILMYHRVLPADEAARLSVEPGMYVTPETFAQHLDWLQASFRVLPLSEIVENLSRKRPVPKGACAITFDDGWRDNHDHAFPALRARKLSAAVFLVVNRIGTPGAFWPDEVVRILATLSSDERATISRKLGLPASRVPLEASLLAHFKGLKQAERDRGLDQLRENTPGDAIHIERELLDWEEVERMANGGIEFESHGLSHAILTGIG